MVWNEALDTFLSGLATGGKATTNTYLAYKSDLGQFNQFLIAHFPETANWTDVTQADLDIYVGSLEAKGYSKATIARKLAAAKALFRSLTDNHVVAENPVKGIRVPKLDKREPKTLNEQDINRLVHAPGSSTARALRDRALLSVLYITGMRVSEVTALKVPQVDFEGLSISCQGPKGLRRIPINNLTSEALKLYLDRGRQELIGADVNEILFLNPAGNGLTRQAVWMMIKNYARQIGINEPVTPHTLRHSRAAHMLRAGEDLRHVREWLGHANLSTTQAYVQKKPDMQIMPADSDLNPPVQ